MTITAEIFHKATGFSPENDDLERCNCDKAGEIGHYHCGWNHDTNKPAFYGNLDESKVHSKYYKVKQNA